MRFLFLCILFFLVSSLAFSQSSLPESKVNLGVGMGSSYGIFGAKAVIGKDNSGLVFGLGPLGYSIGGQVAMNSYYFNFNYGTALAVKVNDDPVKLLYGSTIFFGKMVDVGVKKNMFIDLSMGYLYDLSSTMIGEYSNDGIMFNLGIGFRIFESNSSNK